MFRVALYIGLAAIGHFLWEAAQLPLYTLWRTGTPREIVTALIHCAVGDILITTVTLAAAAALGRRCHWPSFGWRMVFTAILLRVTLSARCIRLGPWHARKDATGGSAQADRVLSEHHADAVLWGEVPKQGDSLRFFLRGAGRQKTQTILFDKGLAKERPDGAPGAHCRGCSG